jgi:hypothetical protein
VAVLAADALAAAAPPTAIPAVEMQDAPTTGAANGF